MNETERSKRTQPWKTANWFVSPWNYLDEVTEDFHPPKKVKIHDITLRDGEQQAGIIFTKDDKIRIAENLGIERNEEETLAVLMEVTLKSHDLKRVLAEEEFRKIVEQVKAA
jgi:hypothetical protein